MEVWNAKLEAFKLFSATATSFQALGPRAQIWMLDDRPENYTGLKFGRQNGIGIWKAVSNRLLLFCKLRSFLVIARISVTKKFETGDIKTWHTGVPAGQICCFTSNFLRIVKNRPTRAMEKQMMTASRVAWKINKRNPWDILQTMFWNCFG